MTETLDFKREQNTSQTRTDRMAEESMDAVLEQALSNFRLSVHACSDAAYSRPQWELRAAPRHRVWRLAAGWALACSLLAGGVSTEIYVQHQRQAEQAAQLAAARLAEHERLMADMRAREAENLLANVDMDVSREVPSALEPLADLMDADSAQ